jgi:hypothetical protein
MHADLNPGASLRLLVRTRDLRQIAVANVCTNLQMAGFIASVGIYLAQALRFEPKDIGAPASQ